MWLHWKAFMIIKKWNSKLQIILSHITIVGKNICTRNIFMHENTCGGMNEKHPSKMHNLITGSPVGGTVCGSR